MRACTLEVKLSQFETADLELRVVERAPLNIDILEATLPGDEVTWSQQLHVTSSAKARELAAALTTAADCFDAAEAGELG